METKIKIDWRTHNLVLTYLKPTLCAGEEDKLFETEKAEINRLLSEIEDRAARVGVLIELAQVRFNKH